MTASAPWLHGRRVTLRPYAAGFTRAELTLLCRWAHDPQVLRPAGSTPLAMSFEEFCELFLAQVPARNGSREQQFVILDEVGSLLGRTGLFDIGPHRGAAELGIVIGERDRWHQGYGRDAVVTVAAFAFGTLGLARLVLYTFAENRRAQRAFAAAGFRATRSLRCFTLDRGTHTQIEMVLTPEALLLEPPVATAA